MIIYNFLPFVALGNVSLVTVSPLDASTLLGTLIAISVSPSWSQYTAYVPNYPTPLYMHQKLHLSYSERHFFYLLYNFLVAYLCSVHLIFSIPLHIHIYAAASFLFIFEEIIYSEIQIFFMRTHIIFNEANISRFNLFCCSEDKGH